MTGATRLQVSELGKRFGGVIAVKNMSFDLHAGEIVGLIGPNGAGKTTTLRALAGILRPTSGRVLIDGHDIVQPEPAGRPETMGADRRCGSPPARSSLGGRDHVQQPGSHGNCQWCRTLDGHSDNRRCRSRHP